MVAVQVGTAVVTRERDQRLSLGRLGALVEQLEALVRSGRQVILVTSGGVGIGRQKLRQQKVLNSSPLEMQIQAPAAVSSESPTPSEAIIRNAILRCGVVGLYIIIYYISSPEPSSIGVLRAP